MGESALSLLGPRSAEEPRRADGEAQTVPPAREARTLYGDTTGQRDVRQFP